MWWTRLGVSWTLNSSQPSLRKNIIAISIVTTLYLMSWQFAQFTLFTQVTVLRGLHLLELVPRKEAVEAVLRGLLVNMTLIYYECRLSDVIVFIARRCTMNWTAWNFREGNFDDFLTILFKKRLVLQNILWPKLIQYF